MAGKPYTMREMKAIVDYLIEHRAYGELKGRRMWMEFANSKETKRTWQSLKETFLKRILTDIHNPYYRLTMEQVRSFQQRTDVTEKERNNRLVFRPTEEKLKEVQNELSNATENNVPTTSHENEKQPEINNEAPTRSIDDELEKVTGEEVKAAKIPSRCRSSADTVVLGYENAEEVQKALESPINDKEDNPKSLKDMLIFEPMTPLVQELLDDFETESEVSDVEPRLKIDETLPKSTEGTVDDVLEPMEVENITNEYKIQNTEHSSAENDINDKNEETKKTPKENLIETTSHEPDNDSNTKLNSENNEHSPKLKEKNAHEITDQNSKKDDVDKNDKSNHSKSVAEKSNTKAIDKPSNTVEKNEVNNSIIPNTRTSQNSTSDSLLPNNQEALNDSKKEIQESKPDKKNTSEKIPDKTISEGSRLRKRSFSVDSREIKKLKLLQVPPKQINNGETNVIKTIDLSSSPVNEGEPESADMPNIKTVTGAPLPDDTEELFNCIPKQTHDDVNKPSTNVEKDAHNLTKTQEENSIMVIGTNPCLLSVNLYEEQFKTTQYSDSDSDGATKLKENLDKPQAITNKPKQVKVISEKNEKVAEKKVITEVDKKMTETKDSGSSCELANQEVLNDVNKAVNLQREKALANVFGFSHGQVASTSRKRNLSHRRRSGHRRRHHSKNMDSNSSEWTSDSDSGSYVSPPRSRRSRQTRKFMKPKSSRIIQDPEEGMLYVIFGKNIYPLVKDGKHIKNYVTYRPDSGSEEDESFWRQKYLEEKKRLEEIKKVLKESQRRNTTQMDESTQPTSRNSTDARPRPESTQNAKHKDHANRAKKAAEVEKKAEVRDEKMVLKIAGKNGLEYSLEGVWNQISNVMPQVVKMLHSEASDGEKPPAGAPDDQLAASVVLSSREPTPALAPRDPEVHEKVNKIESEIFNEIARHVTDDEENQEQTDEANVTKRKPGRPKKSSSTESKITRKRARTVIENSSDSKEELQTKRVSKIKTDTKLEKTENPPKNIQKEKENLLKILEDSDKEPKESSPQSKKVAEKDPNKKVSVKKTLSNNTATPQLKQETSKEKTSVKKVLARTNTRLSKPQETEHDSSFEGNANNGQTRTSARLVKTARKSFKAESARETKLRTISSKESADLLGFDDDARFMLAPAKPNKKLTDNKKSLPIINVIPPQALSENSMDSGQGYQDSNPSPYRICLPKRKVRVSFSARNKCNNRRSTRRKSCPVLLQMSSDSNNSSYFVPLRKSVSSLNSEIYKSDSYRMLMPKPNRCSKKLESIDENNTELHGNDAQIRHFRSVSKDSSNIALEFGSSSVSLPVSPEISIVEKMSISREVIKDGNRPTINESQQNANGQLMDYSEFMISNVDVSAPLMDQRCNLRKSSNRAAKNTTNSESMQIKDCAVNLTLSDTLDRRLRELLLESNKKPTRSFKETPMEVDQTVSAPKKTRARKQKEITTLDVDPNVTTRKTKAKKRSSTPQKKNNVLKSKAPQGQTIEEERVESCSAGRKSCPPVMTFIPTDENANNSSDVTLNLEKNTKVSKKKDVIKVKIQKPKNKSRSMENLRGNSPGKFSVSSSYNDSGTIKTKTASMIIKDCSVDLIHNHSDTCVMANECIGSDSVEFIPNSPISVTSLDSSRQSLYEGLQGPVLSEDTSINQDNFVTAERPDPAGKVGSSESKYHSFSASSLMTEDLSNSPPSPPRRWHLFDEDVTNQDSEHVASRGSNLQDIFPVACAVPNLSTISEMSKENEDSRKALCS